MSLQADFGSPAVNAASLADFPIVAGAAVVAFLSHGVLDGLKHGYPISPLLDIVLGASIAMGWCLAVRWRFIWLFARCLLRLGSAGSDRSRPRHAQVQAGDRSASRSRWPPVSLALARWVRLNVPQLKRRAGSLQNPGRGPEPRDFRGKSCNRSGHRSSLSMAEPVRFPPHALFWPVRRGVSAAVLAIAARKLQKPQA